MKMHAFQYGNPQNLLWERLANSQTFASQRFSRFAFATDRFRNKKNIIIKIIFPLLTEIKMSWLRGECFLHFSSVLKCPECFITV